MEKTTRIADQIMLLARQIKTLTENQLKKYGVGTGQLQLLMLFYQADGSSFSQVEMGKILKIDKANVSRNLQKLIEKEWIQPLPDNQKKYGLTEQGKNMKKDLGAFFMATHGDMVTGITEESLVVTMMSLQKMILNLEERNG